MAIDRDPRSTIGEKCEPKPILARAQVPQRVIIKCSLKSTIKLTNTTNTLYFILYTLYFILYLEMVNT